MLENKLLSAFIQDRDSFTSATKVLSAKDFTPQGSIIFNYIKDYYEKDAEATSVDTEVLESKVSREHSRFKDLFSMFFEGIEQVSFVNILEEIVAFKKQQIGQELANALIQNDDRRIEHLREEYDSVSIELYSEEEEANTVYINAGVATIADAFTKDNLISVYPKVLDDLLGGGVPPQTHITLFARPERGKSLVSIDMACGFCRDGHKVLYIGNEDPAKSMLMRFLNNFTDLTRKEILADVPYAEHIAHQEGYNNLIFAALTPGTIAEIEGLIRRYNPDVLIVDQIHKLDFPGIEGEVQQLTKAGHEMRRMIKQYDLVGVSVTQAGDSARGKLILNEGDIYQSKTALPGDADILIGIGADDQALAANRRMLTLCKNKITADHESLPITINPILSKVVE